LLCVLLSPILGSASPQAATPERRLAVLRLRGAYDLTVLGGLTDQLRSGALTVLRPLGHKVMDRENMAMLARNMGIDLESCQEGAECEVDIGRSVGATWVMSGGVIPFGSKLTATIKLHETDNGTLLASETGRFSDEDALFAALEGLAEQVLRVGLNLAPAKAPRRAAVVAEPGSIRDTSGGYSLEQATPQVVVSFQSVPEGAVVRLDGELLCQSAPCSRRLDVGPHTVQMERERYHPSPRESVTVRADMGPVKVTLVPTFGWLSVMSSPPGLPLLIDRIPVGDTPVMDRELAPGGHKAILDAPCYLQDGQEVVVKEGKHQRIEILARERKAGLQVEVEDDQGNALAAGVAVDGNSLGEGPGPFEIPLCSDQVTVTLRDGRTKSAGLTLRPKLNRVRLEFAGKKRARKGKRSAVGRPSNSIEEIAVAPLHGERLNSVFVSMFTDRLRESVGSILGGSSSYRLVSGGDHSNAELLVTGEVTRVGSGLQLDIQLADVAAGRRLSFVRAKGDSMDQLLDEVSASVGELLVSGLGLPEAGR
jgi:TolB-like protein